MEEGLVEERFNPDAPLGEEDAARRRDVGAVFVDVRTLIRQPHLNTTDIKSIKIVVGKKGSGKTHILKYIEEQSSLTREVLHCALSDNTIPNFLEDQFRDRTDRPYARSKWSKFWRIVISLSVLTSFLSVKPPRPRRVATSKFLIERGTPVEQCRPDEWRTTRSLLVAHFRDRYFPARSGFGLDTIQDSMLPTAVMYRLFQSIRSVQSLDTLLDGVDVDSLEGEVASLAKGYRPFHVIIDGVDDVSWKQPRIWLEFQVGLFDATFFYNQALRSSDQIYITVAIRNFVFLTAMQSQFADRVRQLLSLNWNPKSAMAFLDRRMRQIAGKAFADADKLNCERPLSAWLGFKDIVATRRSKSEPVEQYFLRHTRLSPRNIIRLFNLIAQEKNRCIEEGIKFDRSGFRQVVAQVSVDVAEMMIKTAAEEVIALIPEASESTSRSRRSEGLITWVVGCIEDAITDIGTEAITADEFEFLIEDILQRLVDVEKLDAAELSDRRALIELILWRCNLIAYWSERRSPPGWVFSWSPREDRKPKKPKRVGFHSSLIDKCDLEVSKYGPVF